MKTIISIVLLLLAEIASGAGDISTSLKQFIEDGPSDAGYKIDDAYLVSGVELKQFYMNRTYAPACFNQNSLGNNGYVLLDYIRHIDRHGLQPEDYNLSLIEKYIGKVIPFLPMHSEDVVKLDV